MTERPQPSAAAREWGSEFVRTLQQIGDPTTPLEEAFGSVLGPDISIRIFTPGDERAVPSEWATAIMTKAIRVLEKAAVTESFREHLLDVLQEELSSEMLRSVGTQLIVEQCGINPQEDRWGIFDPTISREIERHAIRLNYPKSVPNRRPCS